MKSHESTLLELAVNVIKDVTAMCVANESADRDIDVLMSRVKHEGLSFLMITLPTFGADFESCLRYERVDSKYFLGFRKYRRIPAFLRGIFSLVFDADTGRMLNKPSVSAIKGIRQIAFTFKKMKLACSPKRVDRAYAGYVQDERDLCEALALSDIDDFVKVSDLCWDFLSYDRLAPTFDTIPKHGPGATADRIVGNDKYRFVSWHDRLDQYFPMDAFAMANANACESAGFERLTVVPSEDELPVRVIVVPKTQKGPRIIAIEPTCMQYTQQALSRLLVQEIEGARLTRGHVNFTDQSVNRSLALISSQNGLMATLDLSSASDRVPLSLAIRMFDSNPELQGAILACRSREAQLPSGVRLCLRKFASMGSALCFPIESMYFYTICVAARIKKHNLPVTPRNVFRMSRDVYIYGDDILVPTDDATAVADHLQKYYCKVNMPKSFWTGKFRESCGMDAFDGEEVTPTYVRTMPPSNRRDASAIVSWVETSNLLYKSGYWLTSSLLLRECEQLLGTLPIVGNNCAGLGKVSFQRIYSIERWSKSYQCPEVRAWVASPVYRTDKLDGYPALLKCLLQLESRRSPEAEVDEKHLNRTARHGAVTLKRRWLRPY